MKRKAFWLSALTAALVIGLSGGAVAQAPAQMNLSGFINDYTPGSTVTPVGPWEIRGEWSLKLTGITGAKFSATLTMVRSDYWIVQNPGELDLPQDRTPHTHDISFEDGVVTQISGGLQIVGTATITANGSPAGFSPSRLTVQITGGSTVPYSNIKLTFDSPASGHFGTYPLDGTVRPGSQ